ncbi:helix-turn-helix transcriptional regulator [Streptomyces sp. NPDC001935]
MSSDIFELHGSARGEPPTPFRKTLPTEAALREMLRRFAEDQTSEVFGLELGMTIDVGPGTIYPILQRLTEGGWLISRDEEHAEAAGRPRPPRRYYRLNPDHIPALREELAAAYERRHRPHSSTRARAAWAGPSERRIT